MLHIKKNILDPKKYQKSLKLPLEHLKIGVTKVFSNVLEQKEIIEDTLCPTLFQNPIKKTNLKEISDNVEYQQLPKKKIWKDRLSISDVNTLTTKSLKILNMMKIKMKDFYLLGGVKKMYPLDYPEE